MSGQSLRIGLVGVGVMGSAIATRLLERGHRVRHGVTVEVGPAVLDPDLHDAQLDQGTGDCGGRRGGDSLQEVELCLVDGGVSLIVESAAS